MYSSHVSMSLLLYLISSNYRYYYYSDLLFVFLLIIYFIRDNVESNAHIKTNLCLNLFLYIIQIIKYTDNYYEDNC